MLNSLNRALSRPPATLAQDFAGASALLVMVVVGLSLPGLF